MSTKELFDGAGRSPRYSLRTLCRALEATRIFHDRRYRLPRALLEGFSMSFLTQLEPKSASALSRHLISSLASKINKKDLRSAPGRPGGKKSSKNDWILCERVWLPRGPLKPKDLAEKNPIDGRAEYIVTPSVRENLYRLCW